MKQIIFYFFMLIFFACDELLKDEEKNPGYEGPERNFIVYNFTTETYYSKTFMKYSVDNNVIVYLAKDQNTVVDTNTTRGLAIEFSNTILPKISNLWGAPSDFDSNGKVVILILDILDGFNGSGGFVGGYFNSADMYTDASAKSQGHRSNEAEILYIDCNPQEVSVNALKSTIAHEYQHMVAFNQRHFVYNRSVAADTWILEGVACDAEYEVYGHSSIQDRFDYLSSENFDKGTSLINWSESGDDDLSHYALSTAYMNFLRKKIAAQFKPFINNAVFHVNGDYTGFATQFSPYYSASNNLNYFKQSFYDFAIRGLFRVDTNAFISAKKGINFNGINNTTSSISLDKGFVPRFLKFNKNSSLSVTGSNTYIFDVNENTFSDKTNIASITAYNGTSYGIVLVANSSTNEDAFLSFSLSQTPLSKSIHSKILNSNKFGKIDKIIQMKRLPEYE